MKMTYIPFQRWLKPVVASPEELYGAKNAKRIRSTLPRISDFNIRHEFKKLDVDFLDWFTPIYEKTIGSKNNPVVHKLYEATLGNSSRKSEYWSLTLFENDLPIGGTIIGIRDDRIMIAFRTFETRWVEGTLQASPALYAEYLASKYAYDLNKKIISHGKDRNPYGLNASIGLAIYKLSVGYCPYKLDDNETPLPTDIDTDTLDSDALILHLPGADNKITHATLVTTKETAENYSQLHSYRNLLSIETIFRP